MQIKICADKIYLGVTLISIQKCKGFKEEQADFMTFPSSIGSGAARIYGEPIERKDSLNLCDTLW